MEKINELKRLFKRYKLDGYIVPKNDEFFNEYIKPNKDRLKYITNFTGSFGFAVFTKKKISFLLTEGILCRHKCKVASFSILLQFLKNYHLIFLKIKD